MAWAVRLFTRTADRSLRPMGVSAAQLPALLSLAEFGPMRQRDLVQRSAVAQPAMVATLTRMEREGLVERLPDHRDARAWSISLSDKGRALLDPVYDVLATGNEMALRGFSDEERQVAIGYLRRIAMAPAIPRSICSAIAGRWSRETPAGERSRPVRPTALASRSTSLLREMISPLSTMSISLGSSASALRKHR